MNQNKVRKICYAMIAVFAVSFCSMGLTFAGNNAEDKLDQVNDKIDNAQSQLNEGKKKAAALTKEIMNLEKKINSAEGEINEIRGDINKAKDSISKAEANLNAVQGQMTEQTENMGQRLRAMYKNGDVGMLEVLLGSSDITEFMNNMDMAERIYKNDAQVLESLQTNYDKIAVQKKELEAMRQNLVAQQKNEQEKQESLEVSRGEVAGKKADVLKDNAALEAQIDAFNKEADALAAEIRNLQSSDTTYEGGQLAWPVPGVSRVTSEFGYRIHPILNYKKLHTGMDIGAPSGSSVVAAGKGRVIKAGWNNSYGNMVMIDHGGGIVTLYAHNSKLSVGVGDQVERGTKIASSGNTGNSTGPHVHFEVRVNGDYKNPRGYL